MPTPVGQPLAPQYVGAPPQGNPQQQMYAAYTPQPPQPWQGQGQPQYGQGPPFAGQYGAPLPPHAYPFPQGPAPPAVAAQDAQPPKVL